MNAKSYPLTIILAYIFLATISGCSESTKEAAPPPELTSAVDFPYIKHNSLYSFDPQTGLSEKLFTANKELILALDIDESNKENTDNTIIIEHSVKAEHFAYANEQTLHLYDINTRIEHQLYDFKNDIIFDPISNTFVKAPESYICDIQKVVIWDNEARLAKRVLYKDEFAIYVKTSTNENCQDTETPFSYWQVNIEESTETLRRRQKILLEHSHDHTHQHNHDDENYEFFDLHNHTHILKEGEPDENNQAFKQNNHEHNHKHLHGFLFGDEHEHEHLTKNEIDAVHNDPKNQEIRFENFPKFIGKKTTVDSLGGVKVEEIDEALMYSGRPLIDIDNRQSGYLGFNKTENALKFYTVVDPDKNKIEKKQLWQVTHSNLNDIDNHHSGLSDLEKLIPKYNRFSNFEYIDKDIIITTNNKILFLPLSDLFNGDTLGIIEAGISKPLFTSLVSTPKLSDRVNYSQANNKMLITENTAISSIDFSFDSPIKETPIILPAELNLTKIASTYISADSILIEKTFNQNDIKESSIVILQDTGIETQTVLQRTPDSLTTTVIDNYVLMSLSDADVQNKTAQYFTTELGSPTPFDESIWASEGVDYRNNTEQEIISLISSETSSNEINSIASPKLYLFNNDAILGQGEDFGYIPQDIVDVKKVVILTDLYGLIEVGNTDSSTSTYFFSNKKSSFNFNNEFKNMKLLEAPTED